MKFFSKLKKKRQIKGGGISGRGTGGRVSKKQTQGEKNLNKEPLLEKKPLKRLKSATEEKVKGETITILRKLPEESKAGVGGVSVGLERGESAAC